MLSAVFKDKLDRSRKELVLLLLASLGLSLALTAGIVANSGSGPGEGVDLTTALIAAIAIGSVVIGGLAAWRRIAIARREAEFLETQNRLLKSKLAVAEAVMGGEPQILVLWDAGLQPSVVTHTLRGIKGLPHDNAKLLMFGDWLDTSSSGRFKPALDNLLRLGRPFNMILKTAADGHIEADGRASSGRAVVRLRDIAGYKRDISRIMDGHEGLARDIRAYRALVNALPSPVWLKDRDGRLIWVNAAYVRAVEAASADEVLDRQIELIGSRQRESIAKVLQSRPKCTIKLSLILAGERRQHEVTELKLADAVIGTAIDVTELELAQGELNRQAAAFDRTLDQVSTAIGIFNSERRLVFFNEAFVKLWQLDPQWLKGRPRDADVLDRLRELGRLPEVVNYPEWRAKIIATVETGDEGDRWWHLPDGRILHLIAEQRPDGGVTHLYVDETERLALESRFNAVLRVQSETIDSLKEGVAVFATDGRLKLANAAFARIWRLSIEDLSGAPHIDAIIAAARPLFADPQVWSRLKQSVTAISDQREPFDGQMTRADFSVVDFSVMPLPDGATLITFADVTDSKRYERALVERNEALVAADRLKSQFIGHVSYELRTPLTNIIGFAELLSSPHIGLLNPKQREYLADISTSSATLLAIIDGILDLATIDAGAVELKLEPLEVKAVIDGAIRGVEERAHRSGLTLDIAIANEATTFLADGARVRQILYNLLSNAVGFSNRGGTVFISAWRETGLMVFQVEDQGIGIPEERQARVFDRFESHSQGSKHRGAGLGLSIVKSLVELHGGDMRLESAPGVGTRVTVRLPEAGITIDAEPVSEVDALPVPESRRIPHAV